jgi:hypothetical protein
MLKEVFTCHPERSEGSHVFEKERFFASLRMTIKVKRFMTHYTRESYKEPLGKTPMRTETMLEVRVTSAAKSGNKMAAN